MKKWFLFLFLLMVYTANNSITKADSDYKAFQEIHLENGKFLSEYSKKEYNSYIKNVTKRKFWGWKIYEVNKDVKVTYKTETMFSYLNDGDSPIDYTYKYSKKYAKSVSLSSTGSIGIDSSGSKDKFKGGLNASLKLSDTEKIDQSETEELTLKTQVDKGTMLNLYIAGEGKISNGVACNFIFWIKRNLGGYEVFTVTTQYYRMEKVRI